MDKKTKFLTFISYVLVALAASGVTFLLSTVNSVSRPAQSDSYSKLEQLETLIESYFIEDVDKAAMEDAAASAMVDSLGDRWSHYMPVAAFQNYQEQVNSAYVGIGITVVMREDATGFDIVQVIENGPAWNAGIRAGDILSAVEGMAVADHTTTDVSLLIRGEAGTSVNITVLREGEPMELTVTRAYIQTPVAEGEMLEGNIGLVRIDSFHSRCASESITAIEELLSQGAEAIIFDVRFNPGGYKDEMVDLLNYLLPEGDLFLSEDYQGRTSVDTSDAACLEIPMAVLVNADSYSAAEFFAAALREYDWAIVVGEQTVGKGYFQYTYKLDDGSAVALSVGRYRTPKGVSLAGVGITPDVEVDLDEERLALLYYGNLETADDPQLQAAIKALQGE